MVADVAGVVVDLGFVGRHLIVVVGGHAGIPGDPAQGCLTKWSTSVESSGGGDCCDGSGHLAFASLGA